MKELSIEEKARRYDEAIERAKKLYEQGTITESLSYVFPELKESEDERTRKALIDGFKRYNDGSLFNGCLVREILAWLEKQGEKKPAFGMKTPEESLGIDSDTYNKIVDECIYGEQKSAEEYNITGIHSKHAEGKLGEMIKRKLEIEKQGEQKTPWLKELKEKLDSMSKEELQQLWDKYKQPFELTNEDLEDVEQKPAWSEEDERMLGKCIDAASGYYSPEDKQSMKDWLYSLKDRYTWKPSDEQIEILDMILTNESMDDNIARILRELREQLKKLKE